MPIFRHLAPAGIALAMTWVSGARVADEILPPSYGQAGLVMRGRELLRSGRVEEAGRLVKGLDPGADDALCLAGELHFRRGDFDGASRAFHAAADANPGNARAWWGLGRIEQIHFRPGAARDLFAKAYRLDWHDSDIILSYLDFVSDREHRRRLLQNVVSLSRAAMPERAERAQARVAIEDRLAGRLPGALDSSYTFYRVPLRGFQPSGASPRGLIMAASVNGKRSLRLVLDTGARGILLRESAARDLGLEPVVESRLAGFGAPVATRSTLMLADSVAFGDLRFRDCLIEVSPVALPDDADGIIGASLFERFRLRIDTAAQALELTPGDAGEVPAAPALGLDRLLLVRTQLPGGRGGWFLLDTGAAFTAIAPGLGAMSQSPAAVPLTGVQGSASAFRAAPFSFQAAGRVLSEPEPVVLNLAAISQREGIEISGLLGYSTLSRWPVTIDFRSGLVRIGD
jgi:tetratricopeptide (TPR) repeat protein